MFQVEENVHQGKTTIYSIKYTWDGARDPCAGSLGQETGKVNSVDYEDLVTYEESAFHLLATGSYERRFGS